MNWKRIFENTIAIFFAFLSMMILMGLLWFILLMATEKASDYLAKVENYLAKYQETVIEQNNKIYEQQCQIEILRTQLSQLKPAKRK